MPGNTLKTPTRGLEEAPGPRLEVTEEWIPWRGAVFRKARPGCGGRRTASCSVRRQSLVHPAAKGSAPQAGGSPLGGVGVWAELGGRGAGVTGNRSPLQVGALLVSGQPLGRAQAQDKLSSVSFKRSQQVPEWLSPLSVHLLLFFFNRGRCTQGRGRERERGTEDPMRAPC